jgi:two-component system invasion response regulator UvrY
LRLLIADDHIAIREGIKQILRSHPDLIVAAEAASLADVIAALTREPFDLVLLDLSLGDSRGSEMLAQIRAARGGVPILVYTMYPEDEFAARLFWEGIAGYVTKDAEPHVLIEAIHRVAGGGRFVSSRLAEELARDAARRNRPAHEMLSEREMEVLVMTSEGKSLKEIATRLGGVSLKTVSTYRARMMKKLGLRTNADAIRYALVNRIRS